VISGASGLVGRALSARLGERGDSLRSLGRAENRPGQHCTWAPSEGLLDADALGEPEAVVHLAGENIASGRWTSARMREIRNSRVLGTILLSRALASMRKPPKTLVCASAIGFYGDRPGEDLDEDSQAGSGFLADVCREWERATQPAQLAGIRVVHLRIGVVLSKQGGALAKMLLPFRLGLGGRLGNGSQDMSWISLPDLVRSIEHCLDDKSLRGAVNAVSPSPVSNAQFTEALGKTLNRPTLFPLPAPVARLALGRMAEELLLASTRVRPRRLHEAGFRFEHPDISSALRAELIDPS